jgi:PAS domain S-box-containing protein
MRMTDGLVAGMAGVGALCEVWPTGSSGSITDWQQRLAVLASQNAALRHQLKNALHSAGEDKFRLVADSALDGILILNADWKIEYVSQTYVQQLGFSQADELVCLLQSVFELVHPEDREPLFDGMLRAIAQQLTDQLCSYRIRHRLGHYLWRESSIRYQYNDSGQMLRMCIVARDITRRRKMEEVLRISAAAFKVLEPMLITDVDLTILLVNQAFTRVSGYSAEEVVGQLPRFLRSGRHEPAFYDELWSTVRDNGVWQGEIWDRRKDGTIAPSWLTVKAVRGLEGEVSYYVCSYLDLTERKRAEAALLDTNRDLAQSRQQLRQLVALNETRLEQEKRHIAREVHDELGQVLTALRMDLSLAIVRHAGQVPGLEAALTGMKTLVDRAIQGVRNVATSLRPAALDMGLVPSISWLCKDFAKHSSIACTLDAPDPSIEMEADRNVVVFRIVQESLINIRKYAQARQVSVSLMRRGHELRLDIRDDGQGFDPLTVARRGSLGLLGMRERVISLGGHIDIHSAPGSGTVISVVIPLEPLNAGAGA